tara:strand:+ start:49 stop:540 length:492 start_codon:yes stop_codon:yes gene_type:complete
MKNPIIKKISNFKDNRGFYWSTWKKNDFKEIIFNHDKFSISKKNVLRGFHCDFKSFKMLTCVYGKILLVIFDANKKSVNYLKCKKIILDHKKPKAVLLPPNFASAHLCLTKHCVFHYKWSYKGPYPDVKKQTSFKWNDPKIRFKWPIKNPILSTRDKRTKKLI